MDQFCITVVFLYYFFTLQPYVHKPSCSLLPFFVQKLQINKNTDLHSLEMQPSFLTFVFQQSAELLQSSWRTDVLSPLAPIASFPHFVLLRYGILTGPLKLLSVVLERYHARPVPRAIWCSVAATTEAWLVLQCRVTVSTRTIHVKISLHCPERCQPLSLHGCSHN